MFAFCPGAGGHHAPSYQPKTDEARHVFQITLAHIQRRDRPAQSAATGSGVCTGLAGIEIVKRVPWPGVLATSILPLWAFTIHSTKLSPRPRPWSGAGAVP